MRVAFFGTPEFALPTLIALVQAGHEIACVMTREPKPAGRKNQLRKSPVHQWVLDNDLIVYTPKKLSEITDRLRQLHIDYGIVVAYGLLIPPDVLALARHAFLNLHPSILPRWRGAAPIQRTIMADDQETAATIMKMDKGLDTGPIVSLTYANVSLKTASELHDELARLGAGAMARAIESFALDPLGVIPQPDEGMTYAAKIDKAETRIDWTRPAIEVRQHILGLANHPGAWCELHGERLKLLYAQVCEPEGDDAVQGEPGMAIDDTMRIACGTGSIRASVLQRAGRPVLKTGEFLRGCPVPAGTLLV